MANRVPRVNRLFKEEVGKIILRDLEMPADVLVTITEVVTSPNLIQSKIYVSVFPENKTEEVFKILNKNIYDIQKKIDRKLNMRPIPKIIFKKEEKTREAGRIEELLKELKKEEK